jgi:2-oxo-4-hydroxy-4-carboxy--5-ureidoimidazoline (OHCU) decarboxylase
MTTHETNSAREQMTKLNEMPKADFVARFGPLCGCSWIASRLAAQRPFASRHMLMGALTAVLRAAPEEDQIALVAAFMKGREAQDHDTSLHALVSAIASKLEHAVDDGSGGHRGG